VPAGKANPSPPIGPALGQRGLNIMEFCKAFNAQTQNLEPRACRFRWLLPPMATAPSLSSPRRRPTPISLRGGGREKGIQTPGKGTVGQVTMAQIRDIAAKKMVDLNAQGPRGRMPHADRLGALDGLEVVSKAMTQPGKRLKAAYQGRSCHHLRYQGGGEAGQEPEQGEVRRDRRDRHEPRRRSAEIGSESGGTVMLPHGTGNRFALRSSRVASGPRRPRPRGQIWSAPRSRREGAGRSDRFRSLHRDAPI